MPSHKSSRERLTRLVNDTGFSPQELCYLLQLKRENWKDVSYWLDGTAKIPALIAKKLDSIPLIPPFKDSSHHKKTKFTQIDLFAGIGGIRMAFQNEGGRTVFSSEWDSHAQKTYRANYGETPQGDITKIPSSDIPDHDILLAGFPCQPFSQAGLKKGFNDTRGTLFFDIARILKDKRPKAFMLENVKQLRGHDKGRTLSTILSVLDKLNYYVPSPEVLNAYHFGVPQNRERIIIVGFNKDYLPSQYSAFSYPKGKINENTNVGQILEKNAPDEYTITDRMYAGHIARKARNKQNGKGFGFCLFNKNSKYTSTISARYYKDGSEALIEQKGKNPRMLTPRECARLQGFPDQFLLPVSKKEAYRQFGNSVAIPMINAVAKKMLAFMKENHML